MGAQLTAHSPPEGREGSCEAADLELLSDPQSPSRMRNLLPPASPPNLAVQGAPRCLVSAVPAPDDQPDTRRPRLLGGSQATQPAGLNCAVLPRPHRKQDEGGKDENKMLC